MKKKAGVGLGVSVSLAVLVGIGSYYLGSPLVFEDSAERVKLLPYNAHVEPVTKLPEVSRYDSALAAPGLNAVCTTTDLLLLDMQGKPLSGLPNVKSFRVRDNARLDQLERMQQVSTAPSPMASPAEASGSQNLNGYAQSTIAQSATEGLDNKEEDERKKEAELALENERLRERAAPRAYFLDTDGVLYTKDSEGLPVWKVVGHFDRFDVDEAGRVYACGQNSRGPFLAVLSVTGLEMLKVPLAVALGLPPECNEFLPVPESIYVAKGLKTSPNIPYRSAQSKAQSKAQVKAQRINNKAAKKNKKTNRSEENRDSVYFTAVRSGDVLLNLPGFGVFMCGIEGWPSAEVEPIVSSEAPKLNIQPRWILDSELIPHKGMKVSFSILPNGHLLTFACGSAGIGSKVLELRLEECARSSELLEDLLQKIAQQQKSDSERETPGAVPVSRVDSAQKSDKLVLHLPLSEMLERTAVHHNKLTAVAISKLASVWSWSGEEGRVFYMPAGAQVKRLSNGNTLLTLMGQTRVLELAPGNAGRSKIVWEWDPRGGFVPQSCQRLDAQCMTWIGK